MRKTYMGFWRTDFMIWKFECEDRDNSRDKGQGTRDKGQGTRDKGQRTRDKEQRTRYKGQGKFSEAN
jgi:hypothetical protein